MKAEITCIAIAISMLLGAHALADDLDKNAGWMKVADGVYEQTDAAGVTTRMAFGAKGAQFDRIELESELRDVEDRLQSVPNAKDLQQARDDLLSALDGLPDERSVIAPTSTQYGYLCYSYFLYGLDSHFVVGKGASAIARVSFGIPDFGPPPSVNSITQYARGTVTPAASVGGPTASSTHVIYNTGVLPSAFADWHQPYFGNAAPITSASCSGSTYAYISLSAGVCPGGSGFVSQTKSYPTCVTSP